MKLIMIAAATVIAVYENAQIKSLRVREKITSQNWRSDLVQVWLIGENKTTGIACYFEAFESEVSAKDGLKLRCENVKLFLREPLSRLPSQGSRSRLRKGLSAGGRGQIQSRWCRQDRRCSESKINVYEETDEKDLIV